MTTSSNSQPHQQEGPELKLCPLCGSTDLFLRDIAGWELDCRGCELSLVLADDPSREGLITRWNTRADLPRATASIEDAARLADEYARRLRSINNHAVAAGVEVLAKEIRELAPRITAEAEDDLVDEVQRRMDQVVEAAVEWHQSDDDWFERAEVLAHAIDSLLELRSKSRAATSEGESDNA